MTKGRRSIIHFPRAMAAMDAAMGRRRGARDAEPDDTDRKYNNENTPDGRPVGDDGETDDRPVRLDADGQQKLMAYLRGKLESEHLVEVAQYLNECKDDGEAEAAEDEPGPEPFEGKPRTGASDGRRRPLSFDERFPTHIRNLGGSERPKAPAASARRGTSIDTIIPDLTWPRTV